jgi:predicted permease
MDEVRSAFLTDFLAIRYLWPVANILLIFICIVTGALLKRFKKLPDQSHVALNQYVIWIAIPALAIHYIPKLTLSSSLIFPLLTAWIVFLLSWGFFGILGKTFRWPAKLTGALILTAGLGNTAFVGFPLIEALYGQEGLKTAIVIDQPGTFLVVSTLGVIVAAIYSGQSTSTAMLVRKVAYFPPFVGFAIALLLNVIQLDIHPVIDEVTLQLARTITPVAMVSVGLQLKVEMRSSHWGFLGLGLFFKLFIAPVFIWILYRFVFNQTGQEMKICVLEAAMAPMVTAVIVASAYGLKPRFSSLMLSIGIPLSLATVLIWNYFLGN